jgi:hypothetical protein
VNAEAQGSPSRTLWRLALGLIFVLAAVIRVGFLLEVRTDPVYLVPGHDEGVNDQVARAILAGRMPASPFYKAPLYMYSLAAIYRIAGESPACARWVQAILFSATPVLLALIGRSLFGWLPGLIAGIIGALYWGFVFYSVELVDTSLVAFLYLLLGYLLIVLPEGRWFKWPVCGIALGLGAIARPNILAFAPVLALMVMWTTLRKSRQPRQIRSGFEGPSASGSETPPAPDARYAMPDTRLSCWSALSKGLVNVVALTVGCCAAISPVTLHNRIVGGEWVPIATYGGLNAWSANSPWSNGKDGSVLVSDKVPAASGGDANDLWVRLDLNLDIALTFAQQETGRSLKVGQADQFFYQRTIQYIREYPRKFIADTFKRFCWFFNAHEYCNLKDMYRVCRVSKVLAVLSYGHWGVFCPLAILGVLCALGSKPKAPGMPYYLAIWLALLTGGVFFVMHSRFRLPPICVLMPFAAYGLVRFIGFWGRSAGWTRRLAACALLVGGAVFSNTDLFGYSRSRHTELQLTFAEACLRTDRTDLLPEATIAFERAYWGEVANGGRPWVLTLHHAKPITWLFCFYHRLRDPAKTIHYGNMMVEKEPVSLPTLTYYRWLLENGRREEARRVLGVLETTQLAVAPKDFVEGVVQYYGRFQDRSILPHVEELLVNLIHRHPTAPYLPEGLKVIRRLLEAAAPASRPVTPTTSTTNGGAHQEPTRR